MLRRYRCWLISLLGVVNISGEGTFCRGNDLASSKLPIVPAPAWPAEVSDILSQSDYGIRQRYMLTGEELAAAFAKAETGRLEIGVFGTQPVADIHARPAAAEEPSIKTA